MADDGVIVAFYTPEYLGEARRLEASITSLGLAYEIREIPACSWLEAVRHKPGFLLAMFRRFPLADILFVDADAVVHADPWDILSGLHPECDIAIHWFRGSVPLSGTIYCPQGGRRREVVRTWLGEDRSLPDRASPQRILGRVIRQMEDRGAIEFWDLPAEMAWIFDLSRKAYGDADPVIEHLQASREFRIPGQADNPLLIRRRRRLEELAE